MRDNRRATGTRRQIATPTGDASAAARRFGLDSTHRGALVDSVGALTDSHDKDALEITLATVLFDLIGAESIVLWRVADTSAGAMLRRCARLGGTQEWRQIGADLEPLVPLDAHPHLHACHAEKQPVWDALCVNGRHCAVFPVTTRRNVTWLVEMNGDAPLNPEQERLIAGLLRIFRNHVNVLEYGDCDELTGLLNRRTFDDLFLRVAALRAEASARPRAKKTTRGAELAVLDIDFFKRVNDQFGHAYGDEVLVLFARLMTDSFRASEHLFRFGGEEFVVLFADATPRDARRALERFRVAVSSFPFPQVGKVTVSVGHTSIGVGDAGLDAFSRADAALYVAKERGRNRTFSHEALVASGDIARAAAAATDVELF
jgi:diguanylate cyclase (GGDEF)-like protein